MRKTLLPLTIVIAFMLVSMTTVSAIDLVKAIPAAAADQGTIAYVRRSTGDIHVISPDGSGDRVLWTAPRPLAEVPPLDLAWRRDGRELAFSSGHEETCSWYQTDVYAIGYTGAGYRRVTNAPACAVLATLPKGSVTVDVANYTSSWVQVYVAGAPGLKSTQGNGTLLFEDVADFGPGVPQPAVGIYGLYRLMSSPPLADVQPNQTVPGGNLVIIPNSGIGSFGAGKVSWKADGSALAYSMRTGSSIDQIPANPPYGSIGQELPVVQDSVPNLAAWGPTEGTKDQYLYFSVDNPLVEGLKGIYLNTVGNASGGARLVPREFYDGRHVYDIQWLPDASGFLFSEMYVGDNPIGIFADIFEYNFASQQITQVTHLPDEDHAIGFNISPDGQQVVFERAPYPNYSPLSVWIVNRDGSGLHRLADDAAAPAWGQVPPPLTPRVYIPVLVR